MADKMAETRFTIQFSRTDPAHLQAAGILNRQGRRSKAQYIAAAVLHYESCGKTPNSKRPAAIPDEKVIEAVVNRILRDREENGAVTDKSAVPDKPVKIPVKQTTEIDYDEALEALGAKGINKIASALDSFRSK